MQNTSLDQIGSEAADMLMRAAIEAVRKIDAALLRGDISILVERLRAAARETITEAMRDAKEALDAGMSSVAVATFNATFAAAGARIGRTWAQEVRS